MTHPTHKTRYSDSSLYDEVCTLCGATDSGQMLKVPCHKMDHRMRGTIDKDRYLNDKNEVAVIYHHTYGSGWSTSCDHKDAMFDPKLAHAINVGDSREVSRIAKLYDKPFVELRDLRICWVARGDSFEISNYDGKERVITHGKQYHVA
jgi:hypothetical protein